MRAVPLRLFPPVAPRGRADECVRPPAPETRAQRLTRQISRGEDLGRAGRGAQLSSDAVAAAFFSTLSWVMALLGMWSPDAIHMVLPSTSREMVVGIFVC